VRYRGLAFGVCFVLLLVRSFFVGGLRLFHCSPAVRILYFLGVRFGNLPAFFIIFEIWVEIGL